MLENLYQISEGRLDTPDASHVNSRVNSGTSAPNCQPVHTLREIEEERDRQRRMEEEGRRAHELREAERLASFLDVDDSRHREYVASMTREDDDKTNGPGGGGGGGEMGGGGGGGGGGGTIERTDSSASTGSTRSSSQSQSQSAIPPEKGSIGSLVQMAKTGYQELVNAIIR